MSVFPPNNGATGNPTPGPGRVPESLGSGKLAAGWGAPSIAANQRFVSPDGDDSNAGDDWTRPLKYLKTAWTQLQAIGGGTLYFADQTQISADGRGLHVAFADGGVFPVNSVPPMPVRVVGCAVANNTALFQTVPPARLLGGAQNPSTDQDDPGLWISNSIGYPMSFENIQFTEELNKPVRVGWDYPRDDAGEIMKSNVTAASRADGSTVFTCDPFVFDVCAISRTADVVTVILRTRDGSACPIRRGMTAYVNFTSGDFSPVAATVINDGGVPLGNKHGFQIASAGADFTAGTSTGPSIGTAECNLGAPNDWMTLYGGVSEFPASVYLIESADRTTITVRDVYGYSPRSATASASDVGTYATQDRQDFNAAKLNFDNFCGRMVGDLTDERFVNGPGMDIGPLEFFMMTRMGVFGCNIHTDGGDYGNRDPDRRAAMLFNCGNASQGIGFGSIYTAPVGYGGLRYWCGVNSSAVMTIKHVCVDQPVTGSFLSVPAVEILNGNVFHSIYLEDISVVDSDANVPAIIVDEGAPFGCVKVNSVFGTISGPCTVIGGPYPGLAYDTPNTPNSLGQTGYWGHERLIAGRHPGTYRNGDVASNPLHNLGVSNDPDDWTSIDAGITVTKNVRDPFGGTNATRLTASGDGQHVIPYAGAFATMADVGDIAIAVIWMRGTLNAGSAFHFDVRYNPDNSFFIDRTGYFPNKGGGDWSCIVAGGRLAQNAGNNLPNGNISVDLSIHMSTGDAIDVYEPSIYLLTAADQPTLFPYVSDVELAEIFTNIKTTPAYLPPGLVGTHQNQKFVAHGGIATAKYYTVGGGAGQITIGSAAAKAIEVFDEAGNSLGVIRPNAFTVN